MHFPLDLTAVCIFLSVTSQYCEPLTKMIALLFAGKKRKHYLKLHWNNLMTTNLWYLLLGLVYALWTNIIT